LKKPNRTRDMLLTRKRTKKKKRKKTSNRIGKPTVHRIIIPPTLNFKEQRRNLLELLLSIRNILLSGKQFLIDHSEMQSISQEALLVLTAEIERCAIGRGIKLRKNIRLQPKHPHIVKLLNDIGYWENFKFKPEKEKKGSHFFKIVSGQETDGKKAGELIEFFETIVRFTPDMKREFFNALIEAMDNVARHAYSMKQDIFTIENHWWLTGYVNPSVQEVSFVFYDQGVGIPSTLKNNTSVKMKSLLNTWVKRGWSEGRMIKELVLTNLSKHKDGRHGNGVMQFKEFIDRMGDGELFIESSHGGYQYKTDCMTDNEIPLKGTLISWKLSPNTIIKNDNEMRK